MKKQSRKAIIPEVKKKRKLNYTIMKTKDGTYIFYPDTTPARGCGLIVFVIMHKPVAARTPSGVSE